MEIVCNKCRKKTTITAKKGNLCYECWKKERKINRDKKMHIALDNCFSYVSSRKISSREAKLINEVMEELESSTD